MNSNSGTDDLAPVSGVVPIDEMIGEDDAETTMLNEMHEQARDYVFSLRWCDYVARSYFAGGVGKVFAIFLFKIVTRRKEVDPWEWVFVGDVPPAYLPLQDASSKLIAFETYVAGMTRWVEHARVGRDPGSDDRCPPVNLPATPEWAEKIEIKLRTLTEVVKPFFA